jgi:hypothetical protein
VNTSSSQIFTNTATSQIVQNPITIHPVKKPYENQAESNVVSNEELT